MESALDAAPLYKIDANEMETRAGRSRAMETPGIQDFRKSLRVLLSKSSASSNYSHSTGAASPHLGGDRIADGPLRLYAPKGSNQAMPVLLASGHGFRLARLIGNAY
jgi:hypothetical protein